MDFFALRLDLGLTKDLGNILWFECQSFSSGGILMPVRVVLCHGYWMAGTTTFGSISHFFSAHQFFPPTTLQKLLSLSPACLMFEDEHLFWHFASMNWTSAHQSLCNALTLKGTIRAILDKVTRRDSSFFSCTHKASYIWRCAISCMQLDVVLGKLLVVGSFRFWVNPCLAGIIAMSFASVCCQCGQGWISLLGQTMEFESHMFPGTGSIYCLWVPVPQVFTLWIVCTPYSTLPINGTNLVFISTEHGIVMAPKRVFWSS